VHQGGVILAILQIELDDPFARREIVGVLFHVDHFHHFFVDVALGIVGVIVRRAEDPIDRDDEALAGNVEHFR
jgi:hypothetical protein